MKLASLLLVSVLVLPLSIPAFGQRKAAAPQAFRLEGEVQGTHDPSIIKDGDTWYVFGTATARQRDGELPIRCSHDLHHWKRCGYVLPGIPDWIKKESPDTKELWAPDISYFDGIYHLYYAFSVFGKNTSGIALLTNKTLHPKSPDYHWADRGLVLRSTLDDDYNAIDPNLVIDTKDQTWLAFGSFWSGIKMRRINRRTGKLSTKDTKLYSLASRLHAPITTPRSVNLPPDSEAIEAPFIVHHGGYYYLFVSFDLCCRGVHSTYKTMVGRSRAVTGPYVDESGKPMLQGGATPLLASNSRWIGPGGESLLMQKGEDIIVFHAYDGQTGKPSLRISSIAWVNGWPKAALESKPEAP
jgi:arabinan endo-1,5-alpha-L-arabinosidase